MRMIDRREILQSLTGAAAALAVPAAFSQQSTRILVGFPPGGLPDLVARTLTDPIFKAMGTPAVVENKPGANGRLAAQAVKAAAPDGRTLLLCPASAMVHLPHVYNDLGYDPFADFVPVAQIVDNDFAFAINAKIPAQNLTEFAAWCKQNPQLATYGTPGPGSSPHLMGVMIAKGLGITMNHIPYRGTNFALADIGGGHITAMIAASSFVAGPHKAGQLRALGITGRNRLPAMPDVPTFAESKLPQLTLTEGTWVFAPAKTPQATVDKLADALIGALQTREMQNLIQGQAEPAPLRSKALATLMREEFDRRGADIRAAGFTARTT